MAVAEQSGSRMAKGLISFRFVPITAFANRKIASEALLTFTTANRKGNHHTIAYCQLFVVLSDLDNFTHEFMAHDVAIFHSRHEAVVEVQVRATNGAACHLDNGVAPVLYFWIGNSVVPDVVFSVPTEGSHDRSP